MNATGNIPWQPILKTRTYRTIIVPKMFKGHGRTQRAEKLSWIFSCYKTLQTTTTLSTLVKLLPITMLTMNKARTRPTNIAPDSWPTSRTCTSDKDLNSALYITFWHFSLFYESWRNIFLTEPLTAPFIAGCPIIITTGRRDGGNASRIWGLKFHSHQIHYVSSYGKVKRCHLPTDS